MAHTAIVSHQNLDCFLLQGTSPPTADDMVFVSMLNEVRATLCCTRWSLSLGTLCHLTPRPKILLGTKSSWHLLH